MRVCFAQRASPEFLMQLYTIPHFSNVDEFLFFIAQKKGLLGKGGVPDKRRAAKSVLTDWNTGKVRAAEAPLRHCACALTRMLPPRLLRAGTILLFAARERCRGRCWRVHRV